MTMSQKDELSMVDQCYGQANQHEH